MFQGNQISRSAMILMAIGLLGAAGCASETPDDQEAAAAGDATADPTAADGEAAEGMGEMSAPHGQVSVIMYRCADDKSFALTVAPGVGQAALRVDGGLFQLSEQQADSGMEFSDGTYTFRGEGPEAFVEKDGERVFTDCVAVGHPENPEG